MGELNSDEHLSDDHQLNRDIWCRFTYRLQFWILTGSFIAGTAPSFSIKWCANPVSNWALFIKSLSTNTLERLCCFPGKTNCIHVHLTLGSSGNWTRLSFPHNQKHRSLETFVLSESWVLQLMDMSGAHDPLCWFLPWWRRLHVGMGWWHRWALRNSCLVPYTLQPLKAITPGVNTLKELGHRDEPFWMERR